MIRIRKMWLHGSRGFFSVGLWEWSAFLLILSVLSWAVLEELLDAAAMCSHIHLDHTDAHRVPGTVQLPGHLTPPAWRTVLTKLDSQPLANLLRDVTPSCPRWTGAPHSPDCRTRCLLTAVRAAWGCSWQGLRLVPYSQDRVTC